jgi:hypothetical protein
MVPNVHRMAKLVGNRTGEIIIARVGTRLGINEAFIVIVDQNLFDFPGHPRPTHGNGKIAVC